MEQLTLDSLKQLSQHSHDPSISIFLPAFPTGQDTQKGPIRLKNLLRDAEAKLRDEGMGPRDISALLKPAQDLLNDTYFWQHQRYGMALFIAGDDFHVFHLPYRVEEHLMIAPAYYVKPILRLFTANGSYYVLAISQDEVRLFEGTRHTIQQVDLPADMPTSIDEALADEDPEKELQMRSTGAPGGEGAGAAMFHGHGFGQEENKARVERYLNLVDAGLQPILAAARVPLVLAGVDYLLPIFRKVSDYAHIMKEGITGSPEHLRADELREHAWPIVEPHFRQNVEKVVAAFNQHAGNGKAADDVKEVVAAAHHGRVDKLMLAADAQVWGQFDLETGEVTHFQAEQSQADDLALLDFAATHTLQNDGSVFLLDQAEMPTESPIAAVFRY